MNMQIAEDAEFGRVRIVKDGDRFLFAARDVAKALGYKRPADAVKQHCKGVGVLPTPSAGGIQETKFIPEGDVYRLIIRSKLPSVQRFEKWVFEEVLPSIRRTGGYMTGNLIQQVLDNPEMIYSFAERMMEEHARNEVLEKALLDAKPKAAYYDAFVNPEDCTNVRTTAKQILVPERRFVRFLIGNGYLYRAPSGKLMPYAAQGNVHLFIVRDFYNNGFCGSYTLITPAGKDLFRSLRAKILEVE